ncbi:hypothetical protein AOLI_G00205600 [Acnodon oligacanthus]
MLFVYTVAPFCLSGLSHLGSPHYFICIRIRPLPPRPPNHLFSITAMKTGLNVMGAELAGSREVCSLNCFLCPAICVCSRPSEICLSSRFLRITTTRNS